MLKGLFLVACSEDKAKYKKKIKVKALVDKSQGKTVVDRKNVSGELELLFSNVSINHLSKKITEI